MVAKQEELNPSRELQKERHTAKLSPGTLKLLTEPWDKPPPPLPPSPPSSNFFSKDFKTVSKPQVHLPKKQICQS